MSETPKKKLRGRPATYVDGADRQAAYRERQANAAALGAAAQALIAKPTLPFAQLVLERLLDQAADPEAARAALLATLQGRAR